MNSDITHAIITIPTVLDEAKLSFAEAARHIPFFIKRFYLIYQADDGAIRGKHAHKHLQQVLFCLRGSITIVIDNGQTREEIFLDSPSKGLYLGNMVWREMHGFTSDTILFVVASDYYNERDYIRDYSEFLEFSAKYRNHAKALRRLRDYSETKVIFPFRKLLAKHLTLSRIYSK